MDQNNKTLGSIINQNTQQSEGQWQQQQSFNTYLTVFSVNLSHRFPDVTDLNSIDYNSIKRVSEFSFACSDIALETWQELNQPTEYSRRQRMIPRQRTAA